VTELPFFVPFGDDVLAAILCLPVGQALGVALFLAATEPTRVVGDLLWQETAGRLAALGVASVRFDYAGQGESTGAVAEWSLADVRPRVEQARRVLAAAEDVLGPAPVVVAGRCAGGRIGLEVAAEEACAGLLWVDTPITEPARVGGLRRSMRASRAAGLVRSSRALRRTVLAPAKRALPDTHRTSAPVPGLLRRVLGGTPLLALCGEPVLREEGLDLESYGKRLAAAAGAGNRSRWELAPLPPDGEEADLIASWIAGRLSPAALPALS